MNGLRGRKLLRRQWLDRIEDPGSLKNKQCMN